MVESTGSGIKQTGAGIPIWPHAGCVTGQVTEYFWASVFLSVKEKEQTNPTSQD